MTSLNFSLSSEDRKLLLEVRALLLELRENGDGVAQRDSKPTQPGDIVSLKGLAFRLANEFPIREQAAWEQWLYARTRRAKRNGSCPIPGAVRDGSRWYFDQDAALQAILREGVE